MILNKPFLKNAANLSHSDSIERRKQISISYSSGPVLSTIQSYDIFLSHSYLDKESVYTIVELFQNAGYSVYVDWMVDTQLDRNEVTPATAKALQNRMDTCHGLAYISTSNISYSKWCPWELGYMDGNKNGRCAILPVLDREADGFSGQEYLGIYPYIDYAKMRNSEKYEFWVNDPTDPKKYISLREWLAGKNPCYHNQE